MPTGCFCPSWRGFNTQPPEGGWGAFVYSHPSLPVSTHSRPKAAAETFVIGLPVFLFQHTAARRRLVALAAAGGVGLVSTHSRPKAAVRLFVVPADYVEWFQHTAARRRLLMFATPEGNLQLVSTHSRPKAAGG